MLIIKIKQFKNFITNQLAKLGDIRVTGQLIFIVIILLISWSGMKAIQANYGLQKQTSELHQQNELSSLENSNINLQNQYYNSHQYLELSARENLGLALPGEKELIVPDNVAMSYTVNLPSTDLKNNNSGSYQPSYQRNFQAWVDFFLHRNYFSK